MWVLILVLVGVLVSSSLLGPGEPGEALRRPPPTPPAVGTCVSDLNYLPPTLVPCTEDHLGEVVLAWTGRVPPPGTPLEQDADPAEPLSYCGPSGRQYLGLGAVLSDRVEWKVEVAVTASILTRGPGEEYLPGWSWTACVLLPVDPEYGGTPPFTGSLQNFLTDPAHPRPQIWQRCFDAVADETDCSAGHRSEYVALAAVRLSSAELQVLASGNSSVTDPVVESECAVLVNRYLDRPDDATDARLRPVVTYLGPDRLAAEPTGVRFDCAVEIVGDEDLVGSVAGVGDGPLPLG